MPLRSSSSYVSCILRPGATTSSDRSYYHPKKACIMHVDHRYSRSTLTTLPGMTNLVTMAGHQHSIVAILQLGPTVRLPSHCPVSKIHLLATKDGSISPLGSLSVRLVMPDAKQRETDKIIFGIVLDVRPMAQTILHQLSPSPASTPCQNHRIDDNGRLSPRVVQKEANFPARPPSLLRGTHISRRLVLPRRRSQNNDSFGAKCLDVGLRIST